MEPISRPLRIALAIITVAALALAAWVVLAPSPAGVDGRTLAAMMLGLAAVGTYLAQGHQQEESARR